jgi:hypothetical protein
MFLHTTPFNLVRKEVLTTDGESQKVSKEKNFDHDRHNSAIVRAVGKK